MSKKLTKNQKIALLVLFALVDVWATYDSRSKMYKRMYKEAVR